MLLKYFLKRFFLTFFVAMAGLIPLFASCDVVVRLASVPFSFQILKLFWYMMPLVCLFAIPVAGCLAVGVTIGNLFARNELLIFNYFSQARRKLELAVFLFSVSLLTIFIPLLFFWAPGSYWRGKQFLIRAAQQQIENLPAQKFHSIASRCTIFFKGKGPLDTISSGNHSGRTGAVQTGFHDILLMVREKDEKQYFVTARSGMLNEGVLTLFEGTLLHSPPSKKPSTSSRFSKSKAISPRSSRVISQSEIVSRDSNERSKNGPAKSQTHTFASFKSLEIAFEKMFFGKEGGVIEKPTKFMTLPELLKQKNLCMNLTSPSLSARKVLPEVSASKEAFTSKVEAVRPEGFHEVKSSRRVARQGKNGPATKELHKRLLQLLWQLLLPFLMFFSMMIFARHKSNILLAVAMSGGFFLASYLSVNMAYFFYQPVVFYGLPVVVLVVFYLLYRKRWG